MRKRTNAVPHPDFVSRIPDCEITGDRKGRDRPHERWNGRLQRRHIERCLVAMHVMAPGQEDHRIVSQSLGEPATSKILLGEADHDQGRAATLPLDQCIRCKRGR